MYLHCPKIILRKMRKINFSSFIMGFGFAVFVMAFASFTNNSDVGSSISEYFYDGTTLGSVTPPTAEKYKLNYKTSHPDALEGISLTVQQLNAINKTVRDMNGDLRNISGFNLYYGKITKSENAPVVSIVYTVDKQMTQTIPFASLNMVEINQLGYIRPFEEVCEKLAMD